ncbi:hypothetical protein D3C76_1603140 [compost metagenome]
MHLLQPDWHLRQVRRRDQTLTVIRHRLSLVTHVSAEIERTVRRPTYATVTGAAAGFYPCRQWPIGQDKRIHYQFI